MKYKFKFSPLMYAVFAVFFVLAIAVFIINLVRLVNSLSSPIETTIYNYISIGLCILLPLVFGFLMISALLSSAYKIDEKGFTLNFGFLKERFNSEDIEAVIKNVRYNKLAVVFKDGTACRIIVDEKFFDDFSSTLIKSNKFITYGETDEEIRKKK